MAKKKAGRTTRVLTDQATSPLDAKESLTENWYGRIIVTDAEKSEIAKKIGIAQKGEYAIKIR